MTGHMKGDGPKSGHPEERAQRCRPSSEPPMLSSLREEQLRRVFENAGLAMRTSHGDERGSYSVFSAQDTVLGAEVSVKMLAPHLSTPETAETRQRFIQQAETSRTLDSQHVEKVLRVVEAGDTVLVVSERINGRSLGDRVDSGGPMRWEEARGIFLQLCDAMEAIHAKGIIHRDLKPDNVVIEEGSGSLKVTDFFLAKLPPGSGKKFTTMPGSLMGTPEYMAPEQAYGRKFDHRLDIYSMGSLMYHVLSGKPPFVLDMEKPIAEAWMEIGLKIVHEAPLPLSEAAPAVPKAVSRLVMKCLEKDPDKRFQSAAELKEAISSC